MIEIILNQESFDNAVLSCEDALKENSLRGKKAARRELENICLPDLTLGERWAKLLETKVFKKTYGEWQKIENNIAYIKD